MSNMSCAELAKTVGLLLSKNAFYGYRAGKSNSKVVMVLENQDLKTELKFLKSHIVFNCDPDNLYLTSLPVYFDSTLWEVIDTLSMLARFISIHKIGKLAIIYEKKSPRNIQVTRILNALVNARKYDFTTMSDRLNAAILLEDLLETSEKIRMIRRNYLRHENYEEYQVELEKLSKLLRIAEKLFGPEFTMLLKTISEAVEKSGEGLSWEDVIKEIVREKSIYSGWEANTLFITPSDLNINMELDVVSLINAVIDRLERDNIEIFVYIPFKYSFLRSYITLTSRFIIL